MDDYSISSFLCRETGECLDDDRFDEASVRNGLDDEYLRSMFDREIDCCSISRKDASSLAADGDRIKCMRSEAVAWILKSPDALGFRFQTVYLSVMYFDQFLARRSIDSTKPWAIWLLAAACLSLAVKMEESTIPTLSNLQNQSGHYFNNQMIRRMELLVLNTLEWRLRLVTPFAFLNYFAAMFRRDHHRSGKITSRSVKIILSVMRDVSLVDRRPSTIAAAAAAAASATSDDDEKSKDDLESKMKSSDFRHNLDIDGVFSCYSQMRRLGKQRRDDDEEIERGRSEEWAGPTAVSLPIGQSKPVTVIPEHISAITCDDGNTNRRPKRKSPLSDDADPHFRGSRDCN